MLSLGLPEAREQILEKRCATLERQNLQYKERIEKIDTLITRLSKENMKLHAENVSAKKEADKFKSLYNVTVDKLREKTAELRELRSTELAPC